MLDYRPLEPGNDYLPDGRRAWWMRSRYDCLTCCLATAVGCDYAHVPRIGHCNGDPNAAEQQGFVRHLTLWERERGLRLRCRDLGPDLLEDGYEWLGICAEPGQPQHVVLMQGRAQIFDPALGFDAPPGEEVLPVFELHSATTIERLETT